MFLSAGCALLYWLLSMFFIMRDTRHRIFLAIPKGIAAIATHIYPFIPETTELSVIRNFFRGYTIIFYALGDVVLLWKESWSLLFFGLGHATFVLTMLTYNQLAALDIILYFGTAYGVSSIIFQRWRKNNPQNAHALMYRVYMMSLATALIMGCIHHAYGIVLFAASDIIIGFAIQRLHCLTYPLYYGSLLYFYLFVH